MERSRVVKLWIGTPGKNDWRDVGKVTDFQTDAVPDGPMAFEPYDPGAPILPARDEVTITTKIEPSTMDSMLELMKKYAGPVQTYRSYMVVGTRPVAHRHPGPWELRFRRGMPEYAATVYGATKRVDHARARRLYSERLRRDRRRKRTGRAPILRTMEVRSLFPRVRVEYLERQGNALDIKMIASPHLDSGQVALIDGSAMDRSFMQEPQVFSPLKDVAPRYMYDRYPLISNPIKFTGLDPS